jgi:hypothetical protein
MGAAVDFFFLFASGVGGVDESKVPPDSDLKDTYYS